MVLPVLEEIVPVITHKKTLCAVSSQHNGKWLLLYLSLKFLIPLLSHNTILFPFSLSSLKSLRPLSIDNCTLTSSPIITFNVRLNLFFVHLIALLEHY